MLTIDQQDFYNRWLQKADDITTVDVSSLIDKYVALFINYNFLYNILPIRKSQETGNKREKIGDRAGATSFTMEFVGAEVIGAYLTKQDLDHQIELLCQAMPYFNIEIDKGKPQPRRDQQLMKGLQSPDQNLKILTLMKTLYAIRCNIVHGEKGLNQYQELLLLPAIKLLRAIVVRVYERLDI
ncbi:hypothetical protein [Pedobacter sp. R-06]|uniref:hypothetical protein n=1 Tax=Pedobacter sp. R-06 TaxID=3404051 RepID=UPI003CE7B52D